MRYKVSPGKLSNWATRRQGFYYAKHTCLFPNKLPFVTDYCRFHYSTAHTQFLPCKAPPGPLWSDAYYVHVTKET